RSSYQRLAYVEQQNSQFHLQLENGVLPHQLCHGIHVYRLHRRLCHLVHPRPQRCYQPREDHGRSAVSINDALSVLPELRPAFAPRFVTPAPSPQESGPSVPAVRLLPLLPS
ncbi:hypothetical protein JG687_00010032, partial [Phytophthora cactorum]